MSIESTLILLVLLIISLSVHEAAHAWTADRLGDPTARMLGRLTLNPLAHIDWIGTVLFPLIAIYSGVPLLGWAKPVPVNGHNLRHPRRDFAIVAAAGPISNLFQAVVASVVLMMMPGGETSMASGMTPADLVFTFMLLNVTLAVFNMIPVPPLDGGNVLAGILPENAARMFDGLRQYGFLILYALLLTGVLTAIMLPIRNTIMRWLL
ncbi:MAG TPA: site-2 protease family protein [Vicinamibacterales bacterium]|nr:site-2 protease family protein [Vicinamibacterales bacterium]